MTMMNMTEKSSRAFLVLGSSIVFIISGLSVFETRTRLMGGDVFLLNHLEAILKNRQSTILVHARASNGA
jgi:hypothetical protein